MRKEVNKYNSGITLIALVITIIVLLILARSIYSDDNWRERNIKKSSRSERKK